MSVYYTDGSCSPNPGPGGFAVIKDLQPIIYGYSQGQSTNIRMEATALICAIKNAESSDIIYTDSQFWIDVVTKWAPNWEKNNWTKKNGPIKNLDLVQEIFELYKNFEGKLEWVRGHEGDEGNELADEWANKARINKIMINTH